MGYKVLTFRNTNTGEEADMLVTEEEKEQILKDNPHIDVIIRKMSFVAGKTGIKTPEGFRDILRTMKKNNPRSNIDVL